MLNWLTNLQQAALCDAAASFLSQSAGLAVGIFTSVSFDGLSKGMNAAAFQAQATALLAKRDELMGRRARRFIMSTVGGS
jgi:phosphoribosylformimino-5-aminoimidazole carboxamide ribonucleotide (ProFAR) isomerase